MIFLNLAPRILTLDLQLLDDDCLMHQAHPVLLVESFVDESRFQATCYNAAWTCASAFAEYVCYELTRLLN
jgi:hypothetical protein